MSSPHNGLREVANGNGASKTWNVMQSSVAVLVIGGFVGVTFTWMFLPPKTTDAGILAIMNNLTGNWGMLAGLVVGYYFGSSKGQKEQTDALAVQVQKSTEVVAALAPSHRDPLRSTADSATTVRKRTRKPQQQTAPQKSSRAD